MGRLGRSLPVYAVGRRTALAARQAGFDHVTTGPGNGNGLVPLMMAAPLNPNAGDILWPRANIISFDIASRLAEFGYSVRQDTGLSMVAQRSNFADDLPSPACGLFICGGGGHVSAVDDIVFTDVRHQPMCGPQNRVR